jgi:hypothetical protein
MGRQWVDTTVRSEMKPRVRDNEVINVSIFCWSHPLRLYLIFRISGLSLFKFSTTVTSNIQILNTYHTTSSLDQFLTLHNICFTVGVFLSQNEPSLSNTSHSYPSICLSCASAVQKISSTGYPLGKRSRLSYRP